MRLLTAVVLGVAVLTSGCGIMKPKTPAELMFQRVDAERRQSAQDARALQKKYILSAPRPVCDSDADCKAKWQAAQLWVVNNANYKLQIITDVLLETYNSRDMNVAMRVTKSPAGGGKYELVAVASCNNPFGCKRDVKMMVGSFNRDISRVKAPE